ncbi:phosphatase PAP2 family protein [Burkholderia perseverans]|uniref:phosphatase PAP2 family protein n=1 Tax=Burkholderia perseverans TaxID=2615214 RepID=UPI001FEFA841|nr:phosphatase PAP2 family protein [Burkholderia perseverans]
MRLRPVGTFAGVWGVTLVAIGFNFRWAHARGFSILHGWPVSLWKIVTVSLACCLVLLALSGIARYARVAARLRCAELAAAVFCLLTIVVWAQTVSITEYIGIGLGLPSNAALLVRLDHALGFDWPRAYRWVGAHPRLETVLRWAYFSAYFQLLAIPFVLAVARRVEAIAEFLVVLVAASILLMLISIPFPAESAFLYYGVTDPGTSSTVSHYAPLRLGGLRAVDPFAVQGLVSMPSFHTMLAMFFAWAVRQVRGVFPFALALNALMIVATLTVGGHYLVDLIAGLACGAAVIVGVSWLRRPAPRRVTRSFS